MAKPPRRPGPRYACPGRKAAAAAGIGSALVLQPVAEAVGEVTRFLEIRGVVGTGTGLQPLA